MKCKYCGAEVANDAQFCPNCGKDLSKLRKCVKCGEIIDDDATFCPHCGTEQPVHLEDKSHKWIGILIAIVALVAIVVGVYFYFSGRHHPTTSPTAADTVSVEKEQSETTAAKDMTIKTIIISDGQPPVIGGIIYNYNADSIDYKGIALSIAEGDLNDIDVNTALDNPYTTADNISSDNKYLDCTKWSEEQFSCPVKYLIGGTPYQVRAFAITSSGRTIYGDVKEILTVDMKVNFDNPVIWTNVFKPNDFTLFDVATDEIVDPNQGFYYSSNENPYECNFQRGNASNSFYKFKSRWTYKLWRSHNGNVTPDDQQIAIPIMSYKNGKMTIKSAENTVIHYAINGDGWKPETFNKVYSGPFEVKAPALVTCYASNEDGSIVSWTNWYKVSK